MNLQQLQFTLAVAQSKSFSAAAKQCCVTQPTLSNAISKLEHELGGKLFERSTRHVNLSPFGSHLLPIITAIATGQQELSEAARAYFDPQHKLLRIGLSQLVNTQLIKLIIEPFLLNNPDVELFFKECALDDMAERLQNGQIDLVIKPKSTQDFSTGIYEQLSLYQDDLVYLPKQPHDKLPNPIRLDEIKNDILILTAGTCGLRDVTLSMFESQGLAAKQYSGQALSYQVLIEWAELGIGSAILPKSKVSVQYANQVSTILIDKNEPVKVEFEAIWLISDSVPKHVEQFFGHLRSQTEKLVAGMAL